MLKLKQSKRISIQAHLPACTKKAHIILRGDYQARLPTRHNFLQGPTQLQCHVGIIQPLSSPAPVAAHGQSALLLTQALQLAVL